ncbi:branched-chain amino acid transaminase [Microbulbifer rhizosphaerae]|uniref:Branched-chain-amino-acid aminotransferase n=1 Tax=Microbulbifer rhizosphaerae TaxID=1562603 RepID=A0A7W4WEI4_9GAMM|nr:branched-chain amino acid transaminase [Microbulbifer rhizosphaerae]MBB3062076.1 branched-chain amino acid aminotransferase [Microbulbifer rhizosphaerae]
MSFADRDGTIWFDGELIPWRDARVHVLTHTLHYGMGVFEGVRAYQTKIAAGAQTESATSIFRLQDHTRRLFRSAKIMNIPMPYDAEQLNEAQRLVVRENKLHEAYLRPMVFYGSEGMGLRADQLQAHVIVAAWEWPSYMSPEARELGIKVNTSSYTRHHVNISMCKAKANGNYINSMLALQEAIRNGCEEALLLDPEGYVAEGSGENIFIVSDGVLYTPELTSCLDGITRNSVIELARECGYQVVEKRITRDEVYIADEAFFTGTAAEVLPIRMLDGRSIGAGRRGPITKRLQQLYFDVVQGKSQAHLGWLTDVADPDLELAANS